MISCLFLAPLSWFYVGVTVFHPIQESESFVSARFFVLTIMVRHRSKSHVVAPHQRDECNPRKLTTMEKTTN